jgi:CMP-N-acetylneuraminic acid synthetase
MWEVRDGTYAPLNKEKFFSSTKEDQQKLFIESGSVYVISRECAAKGEIYGRRVSVIVEEPFTSVDVDYPFDLTLARELFQGIDL